MWRPWLTELSRHHAYIRYDQRGRGLSDHEVADFSLDAWIGDHEAVVDSLRLTRFSLIGMPQGGAVAIGYAARHPDKVTHLILRGACARGALRRDPTAAARLEAETLVNLIRVGWGRDNPAFRQVFTNQFFPNGTPVQHHWPRRADPGPPRPRRCPRAVRRRAAARGADPGRAFRAARQRQPRSARHRAAWGHFVHALRGFLGAAPATDETALTPAKREVLRLVALGLDNSTIAGRLGKSEKTVRNQVSSIFDKLGVRTRAEAIVRVRDRGGPAS